MKAGGFDAVIGNPPYVRQEGLGEFKDYFSAKYKVYHGTADLYSYFIERSVTLLRDGGIFGFIVANKWMRANYGEPLRNWLKGRHIEEITDFGDLPVFKGATTYPCILLIRNSEPSEQISVAKVKSLEFSGLQDYVDSNRYMVRVSGLDDKGWSLTDEVSRRLFEKLKAAGDPLGEYVKGKIYRGILSGLNEAFVIDAETREKLIREDSSSAAVIKSFLAGRDIKRYQTPINKKWLIFTRRGINIKDYPAIERHLSLFKERLMPKPKDYKGDDWKGRKPGSYKWYEIQDTIDYYAEFEKPKIIYAEIATKGQFTIDEKNSYSDTTSYIIPEPSKYLLAILNSKLWTFVFSKTSSEIRGGFFRWKRQYMSPLPIRTIDFSNKDDIARHDKMVALVDQMLTLNKRVPEVKTDHERTSLQRQIDATDQQIDQLGYELYGLTEEEIRIIEDR